MMGLGTDLVHVEQLRTQLSDLASSFAVQTFSPAELRYAQQQPSKDPARHLAARFAAGGVDAAARTLFTPPPGSQFVPWVPRGRAGGCGPAVDFYPPADRLVGTHGPSS